MKQILLNSKFILTSYVDKILYVIIYEFYEIPTIKLNRILLYFNKVLGLSKKSVCSFWVDVKSWCTTHDVKNKGELTSM
jgi:hypothetical protein